MNDKEKYKKALEKAKALYSSSEPMSGCSVILETIFPELKENEDEKMRKALISILKSDFEKDTTIFGISVGEIITWLENRGERKYTQKDVDNAYLKGVSTSKRMFKKQQKSSWNKEDDLYVEDIISLLDFGGSTHTKEQVQSWLKSLNGRVQPQNQWKPSDEQMDALWFYAEQNNYAGTVLTPLYNDLKKLKEE